MSKTPNKKQPFNKPALTPKQHVELMVKRGLSIPDEARAEQRRHWQTGRQPAAHGIRYAFTHSTGLCAGRAKRRDYRWYEPEEALPGQIFSLTLIR